MGKIILSCLLSILVLLPLKCQDNIQSDNAKMNEIKMQPDKYFEAVANCGTCQEAEESASLLLISEIEYWASQNNSVVNDSIRDLILKKKCILSSNRGAICRCMAYIEKKVIIGEQKETVVPEKYMPNTFELSMTKVTAEQIKTFISDLKSEGKIDEYGEYRNMPKNKDCYLFVYNKSRTIAAYLYKRDNAFINLITGYEDSISNYRGCGAIWFNLK